MNKRRKRRIQRNVATVAIFATIICATAMCSSIEHKIEVDTAENSTVSIENETLVNIQLNVESEPETTEAETELIEEEPEISKDEYYLAKLAMAEAEGEDLEGKALVIRVAMNRVESEGFPDNIEEVIFQKKQFSPIANGRWDAVEPNEECYVALDMVQNEKWDESQGALYFESLGYSKWHQENLEFLFRHGGHYFYK